MSESPRSLELFERELAACSDWRDAFKAALEGLVNNTFTRSLEKINETNLPTLELRDPDAYATIKDRRIREGLVVSDLFQVARHRGPGPSRTWRYVGTPESTATGSSAQSFGWPRPAIR